MTQKLLKIGSSAVVTIPKKSLKELGLKVGDEVRVVVDVDEKRVVIESRGKINKEVLSWIDRFIKMYRPALKALAKK
ncbi:MAG: Uncharacterized protein G01um101433_181 [Parcubacteria group bacterium Gr01-1014_33]|nr:MAG: Uncharacterized protein G01um101433_181 [Parcubacteria group bacterium Gr01-1014_33]